MWFFLVISGVIAGFTDDGWPPSEALFLLAFLALLLIKQAIANRTNKLQFRLSAGLGLVILAYLWTNVYLAASFDQLLPRYLAGKTLSVEGRVEDVLKATEVRHQLLFRVEGCREVASGDACPFSGQVVLNRYSDGVDSGQKPAETGERWQFVVRLYPVRGFSNPGQSLYRLSQMAQGIDARGYVYRDKLSLRLGAAPVSDRLYRQWQQFFYDRVAALSVSSSAETPLLPLTLLTGRSEALTSEHWQLLRETGTLHLIVVSGLHIGVLLAVGWLLMTPVSRLLPLDRYGPRLALRVMPVLLILPMLLIWPSGVAVLRALLMALILLLMRSAGMLLSPARLLLLVITLMLLMQPFYLLRPGFYYSVWAVALLLMVVSAGRQPGLFLRIQSVLLLGLLPLQGIWLNAPDLVSGLANLLAIPLVSLIMMPLALLTFWVPWTPLLHWQQALDQLFWQWLALCRDLAWGVPELSLPSALILLGAAVVLALPGLPGKTVWALAVVAALVVPPVSDRSGFSVQVLDVGQGLAVWVSDGERRLLYDTGPRFRSGFMPVAMLVPPRLRVGNRSLDLLIVSHDDNDHAGGVPALAGYYKRILAGQPERLTGSASVPVQLCRAGDNIRWGDVDIQVLYPPQGLKPQDSDNDHSCVVRIASGSDPEKSLLLTGDISAEAERWLLHSGQLLQSRWLIASHHGSADGNSLAFLAQVQPEGVIYSAGYRNRYGHPAAAVEKRLAYLRQRDVAAGSSGAFRAYNTADLGALRLAPLPGRDGWQLTGNREQLPLRWRWQK